MTVKHYDSILKLGRFQIRTRYEKKSIRLVGDWKDTVYHKYSILLFDMSKDITKFVYGYSADNPEEFATAYVAMIDEVCSVLHQLPEKYHIFSDVPKLYKYRTGYLMETEREEQKRLGMEFANTDIIPQYLNQKKQRGYKI